MVEMTILHWMMLDPARRGYYKECRIIDVSTIGQLHALISLLLPPPFGGTLDELVPLDTMIEVENDHVA